MNKRKVVDSVHAGIISGDIKVLVEHYRPHPVMTHVYRAIQNVRVQDAQYSGLFCQWAEFADEGDFCIHEDAVYARYKRRCKINGEVVKTHWVPETRGGVTTCTLFGDGIELGAGQAECSVDDVFQYRLGRVKATGRAISNAVANMLKGDLGIT